jgi:hypothetical protein
LLSSTSVLEGDPEVPRNDIDEGVSYNLKALNKFALRRRNFKLCRYLCASFLMSDALNFGFHVVHKQDLEGSISSIGLGKLSIRRGKISRRPFISPHHIFLVDLFCPEHVNLCSSP